MFINNNFRFCYEKYHPQTFLEERKYAKQKTKTNNYIDEELNQNLILIMIGIVIIVFILILIMKNRSDSNNNKQNFLIQ